MSYQQHAAKRENARVHDKRLGDFFSVLKNRFGIDPSKVPELYAETVFAQGALKEFRWHEGDPEPYLPKNIKLSKIWGRSTPALHELGTLLMQMREAGFITKMKESLSMGSDKTENASLGDAS